MRAQLQRGIAYTAFQTSVMVGIALLPLAVQLRRATGITLPIHRLIERTRRAYEADSADK